MPYNAAVYQVLIASPSDVVEERRVIPQVIHDWNSLHSKALSVVLLPVMWETHSTPEMGGRPQAIINRQVVKDCDILVGAFWTRIGTKTGSSESGSVEEIREFIDAGKPVFIYFSSVPVSMDKVDLSQYQRLVAFKGELKSKGLISEYSSIPDLQEQLNRHLTIKMREILGNVSEKTRQTPTEPAGVPSITVKKQIETSVKRIEAEWSAERQSEPARLDYAKGLLSRLGSFLVDSRVTLEESGADEKILAEIDGIVVGTKRIQRHQLFLDGGASYSEFWEIGDDLFNRTRQLLARIH